MPLEKQSKLKGYIFSISGAMAWGFGGICGQYILSKNTISSIKLTCLRILLSSLVLVIINLLSLKKESIKIFKDFRDLLLCLVFGIFGVMLSQFTYVTTISLTNAPTATILQFLSSILIVFFTCIKEFRMPKKKEILAISLAIIGTFIIATHFNIHKLVISPLGLLSGLTSALAAAIYTVIPSRIMKKYSPLTVIAYGMLFGAIVFSLFTKPWQFKIDLDFKIIGAIIIMSLIGTAFAYHFFLSGVSIVGAVRGGVIGGLEPISAAIMAFFFLKTPISLIDVVGMALVLLAIGVLSIREVR
ncbi:MAG: DMT family transporter [Tissierellia bacterium]|nr:DMT family transporter [Tissierellia bacterium]